MILIAQPRNPHNPPALTAVADALLARLHAANPTLDLDVQVDSAPIKVPADSPAYTRHACARNHLIDTRLRDEHTHVLWIDSDLIDYPADLPTRLWGVAMGRRCPACFDTAIAFHAHGFGDCGACGYSWLQMGHGKEAITAPVVTLDYHEGRDYGGMNWPDRFYDIGGFIENGRRVRMHKPWFDQPGPMYDLDSVGCCYLIPAWLYREGVRYAPPGLPHYRRWQGGGVGPFCVEHYSVMRAAAAAGLRIVALGEVRAVHAWLPDYGLELT